MRIWQTFGLNPAGLQSDSFELAQKFRALLIMLIRTGFIDEQAFTSLYLEITLNERRNVRAQIQAQQARQSIIGPNGQPFGG